MTAFKKKKIHKINMEGVKWPYLIISSHSSMMDFAWCSKLCGVHDPNYICSIEEFIGRDWLMKGVGCFPKRKYTKDSEVAKSVLRCIKNNNGVTIYAEARYSICGVNERIDKSHW